LSSNQELVVEGTGTRPPRPAPVVDRVKQARGSLQNMQDQRKRKGNHMRRSMVVGEGSRALMPCEDDSMGQVPLAVVLT